MVLIIYSVQKQSKKGKNMKQPKGRKLMRSVDIASITEVLNVDANELFKKEGK